MKAMILAAGLGTRLRPLTDDRPKALVRVAGRTLLEIALSRLSSFGIREVVINTYHFADLLTEYLRLHDNFGMHIEISREEVLLDTGGGLKHAAEFLKSESADPDEAILVHNVDVLSTIDFADMLRFHLNHGALATLAVQKRATSRYLLFDEDGQLCGRRAGLGGIPELVRAAGNLEELAFSGIHMLSPRIFDLMTQEGSFPIIPAYLRLASKGEAILAFPADRFYWRDLGRPEQIEEATTDVANGTYQV